jgi:hypothetical protein
MVGTFWVVTHTLRLPIVIITSQQTVGSCDSILYLAQQQAPTTSVPLSAPIPFSMTAGAGAGAGNHRYK